MKTDDLDRLRETLRRGDPAADGREPGGDELHLLRERLLEGAVGAGRDRSPAGARKRREPAPRPWALRPSFATAAAAAGILVLTLGLGLTLRLDRAAERAFDRTFDRTAGAARPGEAPGGALGAADEAPPRQIQFTTAGGTRIVWVLYPEEPVHP